MRKRNPKSRVKHIDQYPVLTDRHHLMAAMDRSLERSVRLTLGVQYQTGPRFGQQLAESRVDRTMDATP